MDAFSYEKMYGRFGRTKKQHGRNNEVTVSSCSAKFNLFLYQPINLL